jgi:hypothetical protein
LSVGCWVVALGGRERGREHPSPSHDRPFPGGHHHEGGPGQLRLLGCPLQGSQRRGRAVDPYEDLVGGFCGCARGRLLPVGPTRTFAAGVPCRSIRVVVGLRCQAEDRLQAPRDRGVGWGYTLIEDPSTC